MKCIYCGSTHLHGRGRLNLAHGRSVKRYECKKCGRFFQSKIHYGRSSKILLLDIETLPGEYYAFDPKVEYLSADKMIKDWSVSCWSAKWLFEPEIMGQVVTPKEAIARQEKSIIGEIWRLIDQADIVITQNGIKFDLPKLNSKFIVYGYLPPSPYLNVDTLKTAREVFGFSYNNLDELGKKFGIGVKKEMVFNDWKKCAEGNKEYLDKMLDYCKNDIAPLLEDVYLIMLPWMRNHPNLGIYADNDKDVCRNCESTDLSWNVQYGTPQGLWEGWRCNSCGAVGRGTSKLHKIRSVSMK